MDEEVVGATDPRQDIDTAAARIEGLLDADGHITDGRPSRAAVGDVANDRAARAAAQARNERGQFQREQAEQDDEQDDEQDFDGRADDDHDEREDDRDDGADTDEDDRKSGGDEAGDGGQETEAIQTLEQLAEALELDLDELSATLKHRFKAAGEEVEVTLAELVKGYQKDADYRRSTARLAEERRTFEQQARERAEQFVRMEHAAAQQIGLAEQIFANMLNSPKLAQLRETDPAEWAAQRDEIGRVIGFLQQARQQAAAQYEAWRNDQLAQLRDREMAALREAVPDWGENHRLEVRKTLADLGFSDSEIGQVFDSRLIRGALELSTLRAENERLKQRIAKAEETAKRVKREVPKMQKPGKPRQQSAGVARSNVAKLRDRLRKTGDVRDAAAIIQHMI